MQWESFFLVTHSTVIIKYMHNIPQRPKSKVTHTHQKNTFNVLKKKKKIHAIFESQLPKLN